MKDNPCSTLPDLDRGVIGNAGLAALIDREGSLDWMCVPRMDGDPVFCGLLGAGQEDGTDPRDGAWRFRLDRQCASRQRYLRNTAILETILTDEQGNEARILDFAPRFLRNGRMFRGYSVLCIIEPVKGTPRLTVSLRPRSEYGANPPGITRGTSHVRYILGAEVLRLTTDAPVDYILSETPFLLERPQAFVLGPDESLSDHPMNIARHFLRETTEYWRNWVRSLALPADF